MNGVQESPGGANRDRRAMLSTIIDHLDHVLPGQAPILNFVHHNTLHGYQHLPFQDALEEARRLTGILPYLPDGEFRRLYASGRITDADLTAALQELPDADLDSVLLVHSEGVVSKVEVWRMGLLHGAETLSAGELRWRIDARQALRTWQEDLPQETLEVLERRAGVPSSQAESPVGELWATCLSILGLPNPETAPGNAAAEPSPISAPDAGLPAESEPLDGAARAALDRLMEGLGQSLTLRGLLLALTGRDILDDIRPSLLRFAASQLDEGLAAWHSPDRTGGLYAAWRRCAAGDLAAPLAELPEWRKTLAQLPESAEDAIAAALQRLGLAESQWPGYLQAVALELPGWAGLINWRRHRPDYPANRQSPARLTDFLAIRLSLDGLWAESVCRQAWGLPASFPAIHRYFRANGPEFYLRQGLFSNGLSESLANAAEQLLALSPAERGHQRWRHLAIGIWRDAVAGNSPGGPARTAHGDAWRLFRLAQHLGLAAPQLRQAPPEGATRLLAALDELSISRRGDIWLRAYEHHYREKLFSALSQNHGRGHWAQRNRPPRAQMIFCMDDREESIRRHLEEIDPQLETLGAAGFFGVAMNWQGLDDTEVTPLCPVVVTPSHLVREVAAAGAEGALRVHERRRRLFGGLGRVLRQELRRNLLSSKLLIDGLAPGILGVLLGRTFLPRQTRALERALGPGLIPPVDTRLALSAPPESPPATPAAPRPGFTDPEQADRVTGFLRNIGLTSGFAPLVVLVGHGSASLNNPHLAAYDCGACSGRHGGPNARVFAAMANRPEIRRLVAERDGIFIPEDTWFLGSEHNTAAEEFLWFDLDQLPESFRPHLDALRTELAEATLRSAHERCRRFASAPKRPSPKRALDHVVTRAADFSQARPELGHATNAAAVIGRRSVTQGAFLDRRVFLISYDPRQDPEGAILEGILLAAGPVGAGINLEYYFSTVNNERFGCGSKVPHNVMGLCAVMEGASSDLRTGLPRQMVEIHEAMRLQLVVEAREAVLTAIYERQPPLRELIGHGWILLSAIHPETGRISVFDPRTGFEPWQDHGARLPVAQRSVDWYDGHSGPLPPALLAVRDDREAVKHGP